MRGRQHLLAIHFRAGDKSPDRWVDPPRHGLGEFGAVLDCAASVEAQLGWKAHEVAWYIAADTAAVASNEKLQVPMSIGAPNLGSAEGGHPDLFRNFRFPRCLPACSDLSSLFSGMPRCVPICSDLLRPLPIKSFLPSCFRTSQRNPYLPTPFCKYPSQPF